MTNWVKIENDAPAVLRALADGKKVRWHGWDASEFAHLSRAGYIVDGSGNARGGCCWSSTWCIETPRDIATDPQVGDEFMWNGDRAKVVAVDGGFVFYHDGELSNARTTEEWAMGFGLGTFKRIEDKQ